ncbi:MAG: C39 family peptidase [Pseudomonadota bacterium]
MGCDRRYGTLCATIALALAVAPGGADARAVRSMLEMRHDSVVVQKWDLSCGAAAVTTLLRYQHGMPITERDVAIGLMRQERYVEHPELVRIRHGFSLLDIKRFVESRGLSGTGFGGLDLEDLVDKAPVMVPIRTNGYNHFVVFRGTLGDRVLLADPAFGNRTMTRSKFERAWLEIEPFGRVGFIVGRDGEQSPPGALTATAEDFFTMR